MLHRYFNPFPEYFELADFAARSIEAMSARVNEFQAYLNLIKIISIKKATYRHLVEFVADFETPSIHVTKSRVRMLRQFFHFLTLHCHVPKNIALGLPYPKIEKTVPVFLTPDELKRLIRHFCGQSLDMLGLRNLVIIMLLGLLGLRTATLIALNIEDIDLASGLLWVREKGQRHRTPLRCSHPSTKTPGTSALAEEKEGGAIPRETGQTPLEKPATAYCQRSGKSRRY